MSNDMNQKVALVFGGSRGIGAAAVRRLAQDGFAVGFTYVSRADSAQALAAEITAQGGVALAIKADSSNATAIKAAVMQMAERFGKIDTVLVNAGIYKSGAVDAFSVEDLDQMISINIRGVFLAIQATVPYLKDGGHVITIGSNVALHTRVAGSSVYQFTKAAVAGMVKGLALDLAPRQITVNNIQPGPTATDITAGAIDALSAVSPLKRVAQPREIAGLVSYLASAESGFMTGASLTIDGGYTL